MIPRVTKDSFPLLMAASTDRESITRQALEQRLSTLHANVLELYQQNASCYTHFVDTRTTVATIWFDCSRLRSSNGIAGAVIPALLKNTSSLPKA